MVMGGLGGWNSGGGQRCIVTHLIKDNGLLQPVLIRLKMENKHIVYMINNLDKDKNVLIDKFFVIQLKKNYLIS